jgi:hypothetical protein
MLRQRPVSIGFSPGKTTMVNLFVVFAFIPCGASWLPLSTSAQPFDRKADNSLHATDGIDQIADCGGVDFSYKWFES